MLLLQVHQSLEDLFESFCALLSALGIRGVMRTTGPERTANAQETHKSEGWLSPIAVLR